MSKEAIEHYEAALKEAFPSGATGDVFHHWNEARKALAEQPAQQQDQSSVNPGWCQGCTPDNCHGCEGRYAEQPAQQQEPFGYFKAEPFGWTDCAETDEGAIALYEHPQQAQPSKPWVGLTDVEIASACKKHGGAEWWWRDIEEYGRAIEAKLREKNA